MIEVFLLEDLYVCYCVGRDYQGVLVSIFEQEADEIQFESYTRIEHVITGYWLHAMRGRSSHMRTYNFIFVILARPQGCEIKSHDIASFSWEGLT